MTSAWGGRLLGACLAATLATTAGGLTIGAAIADEAVGDTAVVEPTTETGAAADAVTTEDLAAEEPAEESAPETETAEPPASDPPKIAPEPGLAPAELAPADQAPAEQAPAEKAPAQKEAIETDPASEADAGVGILVDVPGPGPDAGDVTNPIFRAAHPNSYTTATVGAADSSNVVTQLTSATRPFVCGDTIVYYQIIPISGTAPTGESTITLETRFDTRFGANDQVGITEVTAFLAFTDSNYVSDGEETIIGTAASGTWSDGVMTLFSTVTDVEAGETIVVEYHATLTCGNPPGNVTGNLHVGNYGIEVTQSTGATSDTGHGVQTVPLFANAVLVTTVPVNPTVTQAVCVGGVVTAPTLTLPPNGGGITYSVDPAGPYTAGDTVTVTATITGAGFIWGSELPAGWVVTSPTTAEFEVVFDNVTCVEVVPVAPTVTEAVCVGGELTAPTLTLATTEGITYTVDVEGPYVPGQTVTVTATLADGFAWGVMPAGWVEVSSTVATFEVTFDEVACVEVAPVAPTVTQAVCVGGELTAPTLTLATTEGITYTVSVEGPYAPGQTVTVTATLADGFAWGTMPTGWTEVSLTVATFEVTFDEVECAEVMPVAPTVTQAVCVAGELTAPTIAFATTEGITYTVDVEGPYAPGQTVTVTATLADGFAWGEMPAGWVEISPTEAEFEVTFDEVACVEVMPVAPTVTQAVCVGGELTAPTIAFATTEGVTYTVEPAGPFVAGQSVTVVATLADGFSWGEMPAGWVMDSPSVATYALTFDDVECIPTSPAVPKVAPSQCVDGKVTQQVLTVAPTPGITYTASPDGPYRAGQSVTITATLMDGYAWGTLPAGWTTNSPTATYVVTFGADAVCPPAAKPPVARPPLPVTGANGVEGLIGLAALGLLTGVGLLTWARRRGQAS
ncbi:InlB B-repeat-containing protein [Antribacter gilvus]|uniref:InlB B-repeat-containing protein n=1 Tax=Antribacter gilvus TaxID=2304675 RepID=UPI000F79CF74|nr:hypothetical protein [Antribacter gilvus]